MFAYLGTKADPLGVVGGVKSSQKDDNGEEAAHVAAEAEYVHAHGRRM